MLEEELTFVRVQELAAPGRLTASRCMVLELGATFVELVAVTLISDMAHTAARLRFVGRRRYRSRRLCGSGSYPPPTNTSLREGRSRELEPRGGIA